MTASCFYSTKGSRQKTEQNVKSTISMTYNETMIELKLWHYLYVFSQTGTLTAAASQLHLSQPALSQSLSHLEQQLGVVLFDRSSRNRLRLTETGRQAAIRAGELVKQARKLEDTVCHSLLMRVGICAPVPQWNLEGPVHVYFHCPIEMELIEDPGELTEGLLSGHFQLAVLPYKPEHPDLYGKAWITEKLSMAVPASHPLAHKPRINVADLAGQNVLLYREIGYWNQLVKEKLADTHFLSTDTRSAFNEAAGLNAFPFFVSDCLDHPEQDIVIKPLDTLELSYWLVCLRTNRQMMEFLADL